MRRLLEQGHGIPEAMGALPRRRLRGGNTEARNWIAGAGAMDGHRFELIEYVPVQRSIAGTGAAMAFARWVWAGQRATHSSH